MTAPSDPLSAHERDEVLALLEDAPDVLCDGARLQDVLDAGLHDPHAVPPGVEDLLAEVAGELEVPVALVSGLLPDVQVLAGAAGLSGWLAQARAVPVEWSLCADVVRDARPRVVPDLSADPATAANPLSAVDGLLSYAGVPLHGPAGTVVGTLCVFDTRPRTYTDAQVARLQEAARRAEGLLGG